MPTTSRNFLPSIAFHPPRVILSCHSTDPLCDFQAVPCVRQAMRSTDDRAGTRAGITQKYILCTYFLISIFTTVGFGDVHASNTWEQVIVIIFMLVGVLVFGTLLSEVQSGVMELRKLARDKGLVLQQLKNFLRLVEVPQLQETKMLNWVRALPEL
eukprot:1948956-Rhodomonas_salina.1